MAYRNKNIAAIGLLTLTVAGWAASRPPNPFGKISKGEPVLLSVAGFKTKAIGENSCEVAVRIKLTPNDGPVVLDTYYVNNWFEISVNSDDFMAVPFGLSENIRDSTPEDWLELKKEDPKYRWVSYSLTPCSDDQFKTIQMRMRAGFKYKGKDWKLYQVTSPVYNVTGHNQAVQPTPTAGAADR